MLSSIIAAVFAVYIVAILCFVAHFAWIAVDARLWARRQKKNPANY